MKSTVTLKNQMHFMGELDGFEVPIDAGAQSAGQPKGPSPKGLTLTSMAGCTALDVISILRKMRSEPDEFSVEAKADVSEAHPRVFTKIKLIYRLKGPDLSRNKIEKAVQLSQDKYCGVAAMLKQAAPVEYEIIIED